MSHLILSAESTYLKLQNSQYGANKAFITRCFAMPLENRLDGLRLRLQIIDSLYSTQMNKRYFGLEELAEALLPVSDEALVLEAQNLLEGKNSGFIENLFQLKFGYNKKGEKTKKAVSLISKYLYFLTQYQFPIYDRLVCKSYQKIVSDKRIALKYKAITDTNFYEALTELNTKSGINNFEKLDNLLWYSEKLANESFSLILNKKEFLEQLKKTQQ